MVQGVLFDMDGLMFDTERLGQAGWLAAGRETGWPITEELAAKIRGTNIRGSRKIFGDALGVGFDYDAARRVRDEYVRDWVEEHGVPVKKGLKELLDVLREKEIPAAVATSTARKTAIDFLTLAGVKEYFSTFCFGDEVDNGKPEPDIFLLAAKRLKVNPRECMVLEDSPNGIRAAASAGCYPVMIPDMTLPTQELAALCTAVVPSLLDVIPLLGR